MKNYLSAIEQIMGISLDAENIRNYDFSPVTLKTLRNFSMEISKLKFRLPGDERQINCFLPFPDILSGDFRTYRTDGSLHGHWPEVAELANALLVSDRVIIHDHLEHYAGSAIDGYATGHRYDGIVNWLTALAEWKPLIEKDIIYIMPPDLALSGPVQETWEDGTIHDLAADIYYGMYPDAGNISNGFDAEELMEGFSETEDYLTTLSIPGNRGNNLIPFYNNPAMLEVHESFLSAFSRIIIKEGLIKGNKMDVNSGVLKNGSTARLELHAPFATNETSAKDICKIKLHDANATLMLQSIKDIIQRLASTPEYMADPAGKFQPFLSREADKLNEIMKSLHLPANPNTCKKIVLGFSSLLSEIEPADFLSREADIIRQMIANLPVRERVSGSTCHFYMAIHG